MNGQVNDHGTALAGLGTLEVVKDLTNPLELLDSESPLMEQGRAFLRELQVYRFAVAGVRGRLLVLQQEIEFADDHNPIEHISDRVKTPRSIADKLRRKGLPLTTESMLTHLDDIAGLRVTCSFIADTYRLFAMLTGQPDIRTLQVKDYIANPKPNGYRGLHAIVEVPVHLSSGSRQVRVELQFRTIAMDFWASLEHKIYYKYDKQVPDELLAELSDAARTAHQLDERMQRLAREMRGLDLDDAR